MKVVILGSYPVYHLHKELGIKQTAVQRITSWNEILAEEISRLQGMELHVITGTTAFNHRRTIQTGNLRVTYLPIPRKRNLVTLYQYTRYQTLKLLNNINPDVVHGIGTEHIWPYIAVTSGRPSVVTVHGVISEITRKLPPKLLSQKRFFAWLEPRVLKKTKHLITISPYVTNILGKYTNAHTYSVENPIRNIFFANSTSARKREYMLFVGSIEPRKGLHHLIEAISILRKNGTACPKLVIAGPVVEKIYAEKLKSKIELLNLLDSVEFVGFKLPDQLSGYYENAIALILPSLEETAPMCIAEAMASGVPIIASAVGGIPHMIEEGVTGFITTPGSPESIAEKVDALCNNNNLISTMSENARKEAARRWKPENIAKQTVSIYHKVLTGSAEHTRL